MLIAQEIEMLTVEQRKRLYTRLWFELTIGARDIWSDPDLDETTKLNGLKWLNEIQHRTWHAFMESPGYSPSQFAALIQSHIAQAETIRARFSYCFRSAYTFTVGS
jgi:hypothetical protein